MEDLLIDKALCLAILKKFESPVNPHGNGTITTPYRLTRGNGVAASPSSAPLTATSSSFP